MNSTWLITSELANQLARKVLFNCVVYTNLRYSPILAGDIRSRDALRPIVRKRKDLMVRRIIIHCTKLEKSGFMPSEEISENILK